MADSPSVPTFIIYITLLSYISHSPFFAPHNTVTSASTWTPLRESVMPPALKCWNKRSVPVPSRPCSCATRPPRCRYCFYQDAIGFVCVEIEAKNLFKSVENCRLNIVLFLISIPVNALFTQLCECIVTQGDVPKTNMYNTASVGYINPYR